MKAKPAMPSQPLGVRKGCEDIPAVLADPTCAAVAAALDSVSIPVNTSRVNVKQNADQVGLYPIVTSQYSSTYLYQVSDHIQQLFF